MLFYVTLITENIFRVSLSHNIEGKRSCFTWRENLEKSGDVLVNKKVTLILIYEFIYGQT